MKNIFDNFQNKLNTLSEDQAFRAKIGFNFSLILTIIMIVVVPIRQNLNPIQPIILLGLLFNFLTLLFCIFFIYKYPNKNLGFFAIMINLYTLILPTAFLNGALAAPIYQLIILLPIITAFLLGFWYSLLFIFLCLITTYLIYNLTLTNEISSVPLNFTPALDQKIRMTITFVLLIVSGFIGLLYERLRYKMYKSSQKKIILEKQLAESEGIKSIVITYQHHINSPLMVAKYYAEKIFNIANENKSQTEPVKDAELLKYYNKLNQSLVTIEDIVKKIDTIAGQKEAEKEKYSDKERMYKID